MTGPIKFRDLILGSAKIPSRSEFKRLMLTGYLTVICVIVAVIYTVLDLLNQVYYSFPAYVLLCSMAIISLLLLRARRYKPAKILLLIATNLVVFWSALNDPFETGVFMFFLPTSIGSFAVLGFHDRKTGIALACLTTILFFIAYFGDIHPIPPPELTPQYIQYSFILNYFISITICILVVYFLMNLNKLSEQELIQKENLAVQKNAELQKVNEELDRFVYSVSHDLRSPLSSILGLTNVARLTQDPAELVEILNMIQNRVSAQDHFIREIIDFSRNARTEVVNERVNLSTLTGQIIESLKYNENAHKLEFRNLVQKDVELVVDKIRLNMILSNLIGNAIKYQDLRKEKPFVEIRFQDGIIAVSDNGIGIQHEHQKHIFNMFYRGSDRSTGSGLGLFITREAVTRLNGKIEVESHFGEGSTFRVHLPRVPSTTA